MAASRPRNRPSPASGALLAVLSRSSSSAPASAPTCVRAPELASSRSTRIEVEGAPPAVAAEVRSSLATVPRAEPGPVRLARAARGASRRVAEIAEARFDRAFPHTLKVRVQPRAARRGAPAGRRRVARLVDARASCGKLERARTRACRGSGCRARSTSRSTRRWAGSARDGRRRRRAAPAAAASAPTCARCSTARRRADSRARARGPSCASATAAICG